MIQYLPTHNSFRLQAKTLFVKNTLTNPLLYQSFEWYSHSSHQESSSSSSSPQSYYNHLKNALPYLSELGTSILWLPPGCKAGNPKGNGYDIYDLWDLGEFDWKMQRGTKWGEIDDLRIFCRAAKERGMLIHRRLCFQCIKLITVLRYRTHLGCGTEPQSSGRFRRGCQGRRGLGSGQNQSHQ